MAKLPSEVAIDRYVLYGALVMGDSLTYWFNDDRVICITQILMLHSKTNAKTSTSDLAVDERNDGADGDVGISICIVVIHLDDQSSVSVFFLTVLDLVVYVDLAMVDVRVGVSMCYYATV